ncbi:MULTISPECIES: hypothetical protein [Paenibacillus]|uniref:Uncharacterized protein n=1 Tax=Paenibacillus naphthalenovorans TaxID=162209 RepID=A0A0U2W728_9BACL|nr:MULTISPECIES: hypothetical protein [Paenibacillus]ALS23301.1 hypothetical protein IJ22_29280 [Paenibacillus naphthalenovorans]GCL72780.1 hypothetical protein PN4B1_27070 [Paenibacillus naphthalenovorans]
MINRQDAKTYRLNIFYGESDLNRIIDDLAKQTVRKNAGDFVCRGVKKSRTFRRAV